MKLLAFCTWLPYLLVFSLCLGCECGALGRMSRSRDLVRAREVGGVSPEACGTRLPRGKRSLSGTERRAGRLHARFSQPGESAGTAFRRNSVYFSGRGDQLRLKPSVEVPRGNFTLEMWIKPEGGQRSPSVIAGLFLFTALSTFRFNPDTYWLHCAHATCMVLFTEKNK